MSDEYTPEQRAHLEELNTLYGEYGHRMVSDGPTTTAWSRDPGEDVKRTERTKQFLARQHRGETSPDPAPGVSDAEVFRRLYGE